MKTARVHLICLLAIILTISACRRVEDNMQRGPDNAPSPDQTAAWLSIGAESLPDFHPSMFSTARLPITPPIYYLRCWPQVSFQWPASASPACRLPFGLWVAHPHDQEAEALADYSTLEALQIDASRLTPKGYESLARLKGIKRLLINGGEIDRIGITKLSTSQSLQILGIFGGSEIDDGSLPDIARMKELTHLYLHVSGIIEGGLMSLSTLTKLIELNIVGTNGAAVPSEMLAQMKSLEYLALANLNVTSKCLTTISRLPRIRGMSLRFDPSVSEDDYKTLRFLTNIEELRLEDSRMSDSTLAMVIQNNPAIRVLKLRGGSNSDGALQGVGVCKALERIDCIDTKMTGRFLANLAKNVKLSSLTIQGDGFNDEGCGYISALSHLKELSLARTSITEKGVQRLSVLSSLEDLDLAETPIGPKFLPIVATFGALKTLNLSGCRVIDEVQRDLAAALGDRVRVSGVWDRPLP